MRVLTVLIFLLVASCRSGYAVYCIPNPPSGVNGYDLSYIKLKGLDSSFSGNTTYRFYNDSIYRYTCFLRPGFTYKLYITSGGAHASSTVAAWADWNNDQTLSNTGEKLGEEVFTSVNQLDSITFTVPFNCIRGRLRLRIRSTNSTSINACADYTSGQTTDFTITTLDPFYDADFFPNWDLTSSGSDYIDGVQVGAINNQGTGNDNGPVYHCYSNLSTNVTSCDVTNIDVSTVTTLPGSYIRIYCDVNEDGHFDDDVEWLTNTPITTGSVSTLVSVVIPAISGPNRLRIILYSGSLGILEVEDYSITVLASSPVSVPEAVIGMDFFPDCSSGCTYIACAGTSVFHDNSCGTPTSWTWQIPGATPSSSTLKNPSFTLTGGNYQVTLIVSNAMGSDTATEFITVQSPIINFSLGPDTSMCSGGALQLSAPVSGVDCYKYRWTTGESNNKITVTASGTYGVYINYCDNIGCNAYNEINVTYSPLLHTVTGGGTFCSGGPGKTVGLDDTESGISYRLYLNGNPVGSSVSGTGSAISFGSQTAVGSYTVVATNVALSCTASMTGSVSITSAPVPSVFSVTGGGSFCAGSGGLSVGLDSSQTNTSYQLYRDGSVIGAPITGTGAAINFPNHSGAGVYTVIASDPGGNCTTTMSGSALLSPIPAPTAYAVSGGGYYCGIGDVHLANSQTGAIYELYNSGVSTGDTLHGTGAPLVFSTVDTTGTFTIIASNDSACTTTMTGSAHIIIKPAPVAFNVMGGGNYCVGGQGIMIYIDSSQTGMNYRLYTGGFPLGGVVSGTGGMLNIGNPTTIGVYNVVATNTANACSTTMNGTAFENEVTYPDAFDVTGGGHFCQGDTGVEIGLLNSDSNSVYQLYADNIPVGSPVSGNNSLLSFGLQTLAGNYTVIGTRDSSECSINMLGSADVIEDICVGIHEIENELISVYPNPAENFIVLKLSSEINSDAKIELLNSIGQNIQFWNWKASSGSTSTDLFFNSVTNGIYFLKIQFGDNLIIKKILIN